MPAVKKVEEVQRLEELLAGSSGAIGLDYRGLTVAQAEELRRALRAAGGRYRVVKNNLASIAAANVGNQGFVDLLQGPTGVIFFEGDLVSQAKALTEHLRSTRLQLPITGAVTDGRFFTPTEVEQIATLPSREQLQAQVLGLLQAPARGLLSVLSGHLRGLVYVLQRRKEQLEQAQGGAE
jgi:large subunit ribosomal protein L10